MKGKIDKNLNIEDNYFPDKFMADIWRLSEKNIKLMKKTYDRPNCKKNILPMPSIGSRCNYCNKKGILGKTLRLYVIADDIEMPRPFHPKCMEKFRIELLKAMYEGKDRPTT